MDCAVHKKYPRLERVRSKNWSSSTSSLRIQFDGFYLTRGHYQSNSSATVHDAKTGKLIAYSHRTTKVSWLIASCLTNNAQAPGRWKFSQHFRCRERGTFLLERELYTNLVPRAFSSTIFKMADRRERTLAKAGSRCTKSPKILEIFITWHFEKGQNKMHRVGSKIPVKERCNFVHEAVVAS